MPARLLLAALALLLAIAIASTARAATPEFPLLSGRVVDAAGILPADIVADISARSAAIEQDNGAQLVVATVPDLGGLDIADYGYQLGRHWGIGQKREAGGRGDNGVILLVAPNERRVRIEVGYGLEPVLTDAVADQIIRQQILPAFRNGDLAGGTLAGAQAIARVIELPPEEASQHAQSATTSARPAVGAQPGPDIPFASLAFITMLGGWLWLAVHRSRNRHKGDRRHTPSAKGRRGRGRAVPPIILWGPGPSGRGRDDDHWGGGFGGGFGGFGGGGFGGGGGGFGGGGASGGW